MISDYADKFDMVCGKGTEFIVVIKNDRLPDFLDKARRFNVKENFLFISLKIGNAEIRISKMGKVLIRCVSGQKEAEEVFQEIIK